MENGKEKKKAIIISSMSIVALLLIVGISYAFWQTTKIQEDTNIIASGCFGVELEGNNPISLSNAYPVTEEIGMKGEAYTFTITNTCEGEAIYNVNLESLSNTTFNSTSIRVALDNSNKLYSEYSVTEKYYEDSKETRTLISGTLESNGSITYSLRIWIDENAPNTEQNKVFSSKIVITTGEGGEIIKSLADQVELGDYIRMTPTSTSYIIPAGVTGYESRQEINPSELNLWRVIRKNSDGTVDVVSEYVSSEKVTFKGKTGYMNFVGVLNQIAAQYTNTKYVASTRYYGYDDQTEYCTNFEECITEQGYDKDANSVLSTLGTYVAENKLGIVSGYWACYRQQINNDNNIPSFLVGSINAENVFDPMNLGWIYNSNITEKSVSLGLRSILTLKSSNIIQSGDGKSAETAYSFE